MADRRRGRATGAARVRDRMMDTRRFHRRLFDAARRLILRDAEVLCAVSGGADSMALLHGLRAVNTMRRCGWRLHVTHLDHGLPNDSAAMSAFVVRTAAELGLPCTAERADIPALASGAGESTEETGRKVRYAFFERAARMAGAPVVALGHHADDQAETVLHRILRGTGLRGLAGMPERRAIRAGVEIEIVRPLLGFRREDLRAYLRRRGLRFVEDATNDDLSVATRNRIRHQLLPLIEETVNPQATAALLRLARQAERASGALGDLAAAALDGLRLEAEPGRTVLDAPRLAALPAALRTEVIARVLDDWGGGLKSLGFERIEAVAEAAAGGGRLRRIELPGGCVVERRGRRLIFLTAAPGPTAARRGAQVIEGRRS